MWMSVWQLPSFTLDTQKHLLACCKHICHRCRVDKSVTMTWTSILLSSCLLKCLQKITEINRQLEQAKKGQSCCKNDSVKIRILEVCDIILQLLFYQCGSWHYRVWHSFCKKINKTQNIYGGKNTSVCVFVFYFYVTWASLLFFPNISMIKNVLFLYKQFNKQLCCELDRNVVLQKHPVMFHSWMNESMIQLSTRKESHLLHSWMNYPFEQIELNEWLNDM